MSLIKYLRLLRLIPKSRRIKGGGGPFRLLYLDPPWQFENWSTDESLKYDQSWAKRNGRSPYPVMKQEDLFKIPVWDLAARDSVCLMWATWPKLLDAIELMHSFGFTLRTVSFVWIKLNPSGIGWHSGLGYYTKANTEFCLLGRRGNGVKRLHKDVSQVIVHPRGEHSRKPPIVRDKIVRLFGDVKRCELFARQEVDGWHAWGNEVPKSDIFDPINDFLAPPMEALRDEDEVAGQSVEETVIPLQEGDQIRLM